MDASNEVVGLFWTYATGRAGPTVR